MKIWINNAVRRAVWYGLDREFAKWGDMFKFL